MKYFCGILISIFVLTVSLVAAEKLQTDVPTSVETSAPETSTSLVVHPKDIINQKVTPSSVNQKIALQNNDTLFEEVEKVATNLFKVAIQSLFGMVRRLSHIVLDEKQTITPTNDTPATTLIPKRKSLRFYNAPEDLPKYDFSDDYLGADFPDEDVTTKP